MSAPKPEFPPLLRPGLHRMGLSEIRQICVSGFPLSSTREKIMRGLEMTVGSLSRAAVPGELWVDGSFVTQKIDPEDVDIVLRLSDSFVASSSVAQRELLTLFARDRKTMKSGLFCDSYIFVEFAIGHYAYKTGADHRAKWAKWFGSSRAGVRKGMAVVNLSDGFRLRTMAREQQGVAPLSQQFQRSQAWK